MAYLWPALTLVFVVFKIHKDIDWSWWLVFSPSIFQFALIAIITIAEAGIKPRYRR